jgi:hypothetical protein
MKFKNPFTWIKAARDKQVYNKEKVQAAIEKAFQAMEKNGVDRLVIRVQNVLESEKNDGEKKKDASTFYSKYYPVDSLQKIERELLNGKTAVSYQAVALVAPGVSRCEGEVYPEGEGYLVEIVNRRSIFVFSLVNPDRIGNNWDFYPSSQVDRFCRLNQEVKVITPAQFTEAFEKGIAEYKAITLALLDKAGVWGSLERLDSTGSSLKWDKTRDPVAQIKANLGK